MTFSPSLQTVLTVLSGTAEVRARSFPWGPTVDPFAIGSQGAWAIDATGVEPMHFYLGFDGRQVHVAAASPTSQLWIGGTPVGPTWVPVPVGTELRFGEARIGVTCEEIPAQASPYAPPASPIPPSPMSSPSRRTHVLADHRTPPPGPLGAARRSPSEEPPAQPKAPVLGFVTVQPEVRVHGDPVAPSPAQPPAPQPSPGYSAPLNAPSPAAAASRTVSIEPPRIQPTPAPSFHGVVQNPGLTLPVGDQRQSSPPPAGPGLDAVPNAFGGQTVVTPFGHAGVAPAGHAGVAPLGHAGVAKTPSTAPLGQPGFGSGSSNASQASTAGTSTMSTAPSARRPLEQALAPPAETGITVSDDGALRDLAAQVATGIAAAQESAAQDAYLAQVRKKAGSTPPRTDIAPGPFANVGPAYPPTGPSNFAPQPLPTPAPAGTPPPEGSAAEQPGPGGWGPPGYGAQPVNLGAESPHAAPITAPPKDAAKPPSRFAAAWRETSLVKKITLVLLPFAGYFGLIWEPPEEAPPEVPAVTQRARPAPKPSGAATAAKASASSASSTTAASSAPQAPASATSPAASGSASTVSSAANSSASAAAAASASKPKGDSPPRVEAAPAVVAPGGSGSASPAVATMARDAYYAALEGRLAEAARRYESLSKISDQRVYSLAARFAREQAVRKP